MSAISTFKKKWPGLLVLIVPLAVIFVESLLFLRKHVGSASILEYGLTLWQIRIVLSAILIFYTLWLWTEDFKPIRFLLTHIVGFVGFTVLHVGITMNVLRSLIEDPNLDLFRLSGQPESSVFLVLLDNVVTVNAVVYFSVVASCYAAKYATRAIVADRKRLELEKMLVQSQLVQLKGQLDRHFLFNTLHAISSLIVRNRNETANKMLIGLSELLRFSLNGNVDNLISLKKELELVHVYIEIQKERFKERLATKVEAPANLSNAAIPPFILQPIIENAIKHGVEPFPGKGSVHVKVQAENEALVMTVIDSGEIPCIEENLGKGVGLINTRERLAKMFPGENCLSIVGTAEGTTVTIKIPLKFIDESATENPDR